MQREYVSNAVFGLEDGFVSTVGSLVGIAATAPSLRFVISAGFVIVFVEAFSMGVGSYLSEETEHQIDHEGHTDSLWWDALIMFLAYVFAGFIVLTPYFFFSRPYAQIISVLCSLMGLFLLGFVKGRIAKRSSWREGLKMLLIAGVTVFVGLSIGNFGNQILGE